MLARRVELVDAPRRGGDDHGPAVDLEPDQTAVLQQTDGLAHRVAGDAEFGGDGALAQALARPEGAGEDPLRQTVGDLLCGRGPLGHQPFKCRHGVIVATL